MIRIKFVLFTAFSVFFFEAQADTVHLGLKVHYETGMSHVQKKDFPIIGTLTKVSKILPNSRILIGGHTDTVGSYEMNVELSKSRAEILKQLLVKNGVPAEQIETKWFSYDAPIASNDTEEGREKNRRVVASYYGLSAREAKGLARAAESSTRFYVIAIENDQVTNYVAEVLTPKLPQREIAQEEPAVPEPEEEESFEEDLNQGFYEAPAIVQKIRKPNERNRYFISWGLTDNQLVATRTGFAAYWVTDFNQKISAGYQYKMGKKLWFGGSAAYSIQQYRAEEGSVYTWDEVTPNLFSASINLDLEVSPIWNFGFDGYYGEENFVTSQGLNIFLRKAALFGTSFRGSVRVQESRNLRSRLKVLLDLPLSGSDELEPKGQLGYLFGTDITFKNIMKHHEINLGIIYGVRNLESFQNEQHEDIFGVELQFRNKKWL